LVVDKVEATVHTQEATQGMAEQVERVLLFFFLLLLLTLKTLQLWSVLAVMQGLALAVFLQ
jgi:hypothetical protein